MKKIAIIGECMIELSGQLFGQMSQTYGGDTLNTSVYLSRLENNNYHIQYITVLGRDNLSQKLKAAWHNEGIGTDFVLEDDEHSPGIYLIELDKDGERTFLYWREQSAARYIVKHPDFSGVMASLADFHFVYISGISLAILPSEDRFVMVNELKSLSQKGVRIIFDSNYRVKLWKHPETAREIYKLLLSFVEIALVTFSDEHELWGDKTYQDTFSRLRYNGVKQCIVKDGSNGAYFSTAKRSGHIPAELVEQVVDTTAAGDAFNAGFLANYFKEQSIADCCRLGNKVASIVIQHHGAIIDKENFLNSFK